MRFSYNKAGISLEEEQNYLRRMTIQCDICWEQLEKPPAPKDNSPGASLLSLSLAGKGKGDSSTSAPGACLATPCGHLYHRKCINDWLDVQTARKETKSCPACRRRLVKTSKLVEIFPSYSDDLERQIDTLRKEVQELTSNLTETTFEAGHLRVENKKLKNELALTANKKTKGSRSSEEEEARRGSPFIPLVAIDSPVRSTRSKKAPQKSDKKASTTKRAASMDPQTKPKKKASDLEANTSVSIRPRSTVNYVNMLKGRAPRKGI